MKHNQLENGGHFGVAVEANLEGVLLQIGDKYGDQARVCLTKHEVTQVIAKLRRGLSNYVAQMDAALDREDEASAPVIEN